MRHGRARRFCAESLRYACVLPLDKLLAVCYNIGRLEGAREEREVADKRQLNVRINEMTRRQIDGLAERERMTAGEVVTIAVDRMYQEEDTMNRQEELDQHDEVTRGLREQGGIWAEAYRASGRLTGHTSDVPVLMNTGDVAPGWVWFATQEEFDEALEDSQLG